MLKEGRCLENEDHAGISQSRVNALTKKAGAAVKSRREPPESRKNPRKEPAEPHVHLKTSTRHR